METQWRALLDDLGPEKVLLISDHAAGLEAAVVVDNTSAGPAIGGVRMAPDVTVAEVARLARAMTYKNAAAGLPHGGGKAGIVANPDIPASDKERLVRALGRAIEHLTDYIPGPDMGVDEACMAHLHDEIGRVVGLPKVLGGIPLDSLGATAYGLAVAAEAAEELGILRVEGATVVIQGFGAVGTHAARFLAERGARVVGVADSRGATASPDGLDVEKLLAWKAEGHPVHEFGGGTSVDPGSLVGHECDVWVPAARPDVFTAGNAAEVRAQVILPGANIAVTDEADRIFHERGIVSIPDFIANAGGVICGAVEYAGGSSTDAFAAIEEKVGENVRQVLELARSQKIMPATAAMQLARQRVIEAKSYRRRF